MYGSCQVEGTEACWVLPLEDASRSSWVRSALQASSTSRIYSLRQASASYYRTARRLTHASIAMTPFSVTTALHLGNDQARACRLAGCLRHRTAVRPTCCAQAKHSLAPHYLAKSPLGIACASLERKCLRYSYRWCAVHRTHRACTARRMLM